MFYLLSTLTFWPFDAKLGFEPYTPTSGIFDIGVVPATPGLLLITLAAIKNKKIKN